MNINYSFKNAEVNKRPFIIPIHPKTGTMAALRRFSSLAFEQCLAGTRRSQTGETLGANSFREPISLLIPAPTGVFDMPGIMSWEEMNWLLPDFDETGLVYHGTRNENLVGIFQRGLIPRFKEDPTAQYHTIYEAHYRYRPNFIPNWVDPRKCIFGYMNRARQGGSDGIVDGKVNNVIIGIETEDHIIERIWTACVQFSDMVYGPEEGGYFDTPERKAFFKDRMEPVACEAYWKTSLSFAENLKIRLDHLLSMQGYHELLICSEIAPESLSLQGFRVQGSNGIREVLKSDLHEVFLNAEEKLRNNVEIVQELKAVTEFCERAVSA